MGLSHQAIINAHPDIELVAVCDTAPYLLDILGKYTSVKTYADYRKLLMTEKLDAAFIATPSRFHAEMVRAALDADLHVFCEKPFCLNVTEGSQLVELAERKKRVNQVGYHYRFVGVFHEMKRLLDLNAIGKVHNIRAEAYGPVVLRPKGGTWRTNKSDGGGCLYDYASHAIDLMNYLVGRPEAVAGTVMNRLFSADVADEVYASLFYAGGMTGQIATNWSDESQRKMSLKITVWGTNGKMAGERQELQIYIRDDTGLSAELSKGWNTHYATELAQPVCFYLRGEEYSAQIDHFVQAIKAGRLDGRSTFRSAVDADLVVSAMARDAEGKRTPTSVEEVIAVPKPRTASFWDAFRRPKQPNIRSAPL
jgi:scyllo-inositol 2-dehydrogenase (NADP+)